MKGVFLDTDSIAPRDLDLEALTSMFTQLTLFPSTQNNQRLERISDAQVVITNKIPIDKKLMDSAKSLKLILVAATGANNIDLEAAQQAGIAVANVTGYSAPSVAQHSFALILSLSTHLIEYTNDVQAGVWGKNHFFCLLHHPISELNGKNLVIVGYGEIGKAVAQVAEGFGMNVLIADSLGPAKPSNHQDKYERLPLEQLFPVADVLTLHCPLTPQTENVIAAQQLAAMKPSALLINTARGGLVHEGDLLEALQSRTIGGAGIDVLTTEPPEQGNVLLNTGLPNLIVTPHCAWGSLEARQRLVDEMVLNLKAFIQDQPRNRLT